MDLLSLFQLLVIMNWLFLFLSFNKKKKKKLLIAIVSLQFILLQYSCAPFVLTKKLYIYIYIYICSCTWTLNLQKTQLMNCRHAKKISYKPHM